MALGPHAEAQPRSRGADRYHVYDADAVEPDDPSWIARTPDEAYDTYRRSAHLDSKAAALRDLATVRDPRVESLWDDFLRAARDVDVDRASLMVLAALVDALVGVGQQHQHGIFSDGPAPDRPFIKTNLNRYAARRAKAWGRAEVTGDGPVRLPRRWIRRRGDA